MKPFLLTTQKKICLMALMLLMTSVGYSATFTAGISGNFSNSTTWVGNVAPSFTDSMDMIVIPTGITVNLDNNLTLTGALAGLRVEGTLSTSTSSSITNILGTISGAGAIVVNKVDMGVGSLFTFTGSLTANTITFLTSIQTSATLLVNQTLNLTTGTLTLVSGGKMDLAPNGTIVIAGGILTKGVGGMIGLTGNYNVTYTDNSSIVGVELSGTGLKNVTVNVDSSKTVTLTSDLTVPGVLSLTKGSLVLAGNNLTINGTIDSLGTGTITTTATSTVSLNSPVGTVGTLVFSGTNAVVKNLIVNVGAGNTANISGIISIDSNLQLNSGTLNFNNSTLAVKSISGSGFLSGNSSSNLDLSSASGVQTSLKFAANGQALKDLTIPTGVENTVTLASPLTVHGVLTLPTGSTLNLNGNSLTLGNGSSIMGTGSLATNATSDLTINSIIGITPISISDSIRNLTINSGAGSVTLSKDLTVGGMLSLQSGTLVLNGKNLTVNGTIAEAGNGMVSSSAASTVTFNSPTGTVGTLAFSTTASTVKDMIVNVGAGNKANVRGNIFIDNALQLNSGILNFSNASLTVNGTINGTGMLSGNSSSNLDLSSVAGQPIFLTFAPEGQIVKDLKLPTNISTSVSLASSLTVNGVLTLPPGTMLKLNANALTFGAVSSIAGLGSIVTDGTSDVTVNSTAGISPLPISVTVRNLTINSGAGNVTLGKDLSVSGTLSLQSGFLVLNANDLTINGTIAVEGNGSISSDGASDVSIATLTSPIGTLNFSANANTVRNFTVAIVNGASVTIGSNLNIESNLQFFGGTMNIEDNLLSFGLAGAITGSNNFSYINTEGGGSVQLFITAGGNSSTNFPVGTSTHFAPASVKLNTGSSSGQVQVGVVNDVKAQGTVGVDLSMNQPLVDATWDVKSNIVTNLNMNLQVMWSKAMEVNGFNRNSAYVSHYINGKWDSSTISAAVKESDSLYSMVRNGLTSLSPFTVFDMTTTDVTELTADITFEVFPNPSTDNINIRNMAASAEPVIVDIYNSIGQLIASYSLTDVTSTISVKELQSGVYFIKFYNSGVHIVKSFTKM